MSESKLVLVTGATGKQGGAVVAALLTRGHQVRALTRNPASPAALRLRQQGVEIAVGDFTDHDSLDFIIARDGRIAALYLFFDKPP